jgi:hypothetical protein
VLLGVFESGAFPGTGELLPPLLLLLLPPLPPCGIHPTAMCPTESLMQSQSRAAQTRPLCVLLLLLLPLSIPCLPCATQCCPAGLWTYLKALYPPDSITVPFSLVEAAVGIANVAGAPLAAGLLLLDGAGGWEGWRW